MVGRRLRAGCGARFAERSANLGKQIKGMLLRLFPCIFTCYYGNNGPTAKGGGAMEKAKRPVQIQLEQENFDVLRIWAASRGVSPNELICDLARKEADRVRDKVAALLE